MPCGLEGFGKFSPRKLNVLWCSSTCESCAGRRYLWSWWGDKCSCQGMGLSQDEVPVLPAGKKEVMAILGCVYRRAVCSHHTVGWILFILQRAVNAVEGEGESYRQTTWELGKTRYLIHWIYGEKKKKWFGIYAQGWLGGKLWKQGNVTLWILAGSRI